MSCEKGCWRWKYLGTDYLTVNGKKVVREYLKCKDCGDEVYYDEELKD